MTHYAQPKAPGTPMWTDITSPDPEASRKFYRAVFGWEFDVGGPEFGGYATGRKGKHTTAGVGGNMPGAPPAPAAWTLYFASGNAAADVDRAVKLGAKTLFPAMQIGEFGSMAILQDPGGAVFGLWQAGQHIGWQVANEPDAPAWYELYATDAKASRDFYCAFLGASAEPMPGDMEYYTLKRGDEPLCGVMQIQPSWGPLPPHWTTYFAVANADATVAKVTANGGKVFGPIDPSPFGRIAALADQFGAMFKIVQPPG